MAFCTGCGTQLDAAAKFCNKCGTAVPAAVAPPAAAPTAAAAPRMAPAQPAAPASGGSSALKVIVIIFLVIVGLGILGSAVAGYFIYNAAQRAKADLRQGITVNSSQDATEVAKQLGVDVYPGAKSAGESSSVSIGGFSTGAAEFSSDDAPDKVADFYRKRYPRSKVNVSSENQQVLVIPGHHGMITITVEPDGSGSRIKIASVGEIPGGSSSGSDESN